MRSLVVTYLLMLGCLVGFGQQVFMQRYSKQDYQGGDQNWGFAQDKKGILYIANNDGVLRYNGEKWEMLQVPGQHYAFYIAFDSQDRLYTGSYNELGFFEKDSSGRYQYNSLLKRLPDSQRHVKNITQVVVFNDTVLFKGPDHIYVYAGGQFTVIAANGYLLRFRKRPWLLDKDGLHTYKDLGFGAAWPSKELNGLRIDRIKDYTGNACLLLDDKRTLWIFDPDAGTGNKLRPFFRTPNAFLKDSAIFNFFYLDNGNLVLQLATGLLIVDEEGKTVNFISNATFDTDIRYARFFQDSHHNLWLTATNSFIFQLITSSPLSYFDKNNGIRGTILSMGASGEMRYVGTTEGIFYQDKERQFHAFPHIANEAWNFYDFSGKLYVAHETGVFEVNGTQLRKLVDQPSVYCLCEVRESQDRLLMGTFNAGIWVLEKKGNTWSKRRIKGFDEEVDFIEENTDGIIWAGNYTTGIFRLQFNQTWDSVIDKRIYDAAKGLPRNINNRVFKRRNGDLLALTSDGVYSYDKEKDRFVPVERFRQSIPAGWHINAMAESSDGDIYFRGGPAGYREMAGFLHRQPDGSFAFVQSPFPKIAMPVQRQGVERIEETRPLLITGPDEIWMGVNDRVVTYDPTRKTYFNDSLPIYIGGVWSGDSLMYSGDKAISLTPDLPYSRDKLRFYFFTPYYESPERLEYQYKLQGFANDWSPWSHDNEAAFINLPEGDYVFWARVRNIYGQTGSPVAFPFHIHPPWYRSWWALLFYIFVFLFLIFAAVGSYTKHIAARNRALERKVEEKTREIAENVKKLKDLNASKDRLFSIVSHDLRGPISTMKAVVDLMKNAAMSEQDVRSFGTELGDHLFVTSQLLNNLLQWSKAQMEGIQPVHHAFGLQDVAAESCQLFRAMAASRNIRVVNEVPETCRVYADKDIIRMVIRNLTSNAIKFSRSGGEVIIGAETSNNMVEVFVKDMGVGISEEGIARITHKHSFHKPDATGQVGAGLGLLLSQELIEKEGGNIVIESRPGEGSRFSFLVPVVDKGLGYPVAELT